MDESFFFLFLFFFFLPFLGHTVLVMVAFVLPYVSILYYR
jgi:Ca2+/Na+ antiporter